MAMSDTGSSFAQWAGLYDSDPLPEAAFPDGSNITVPAATSPTSAGSGGSGSPTKLSVAQYPGIEGPRVGKPAAAARRRSRASRRAPVTLLNTDTSNFRAMVQQFTGIPAGAFGAPAGVPVINFAGDYGFPPPAAAGMVSFDHLYHRSQQQQHPPAPLHDQLMIRRQPQPQYTGGAFGYHNNSLLHAPAGGGDVFALAEDRMLLQSFQAAQMPPESAANNTASLGFFA